MNYERLIKAGVDVEKLFKRLMGNTSLVGVFIKKFTEDTTFENLKAAFEAKDMRAAEMASHSLKGMCGNLSLEQLFGLFTEQTNLIRQGDFTKAENMMCSITSVYNAAIENMKEWVKEN